MNAWGRASPACSCTLSGETAKRRAAVSGSDARALGQTAPSAARRRRTKLVLAEDPDEEKDQRAENEREHERRRARDADRQHPEPEKEEEQDGPEKRLNAVIDRRRPQVQDELTLQIHPEHERASRRRLFHSPSRSRFCPPHPLTFGFRLRPPGEASIYSRPVLDATGTLGAGQGECKHVQNGQRAFCELFFYQHFHSDSSNLWRTSRPLSTDVSTPPGGPENHAAQLPRPLSTSPHLLSPHLRFERWGEVSC